MSNANTLPMASRPVHWEHRTLSSDEELYGRLFSEDDRKSLSEKDFRMRDHIENTIETLDYLRGISELEPRFSNLMDDVIQTAVTLCNYTNETAISSLENEKQLASNDDASKGLSETRNRVDTCWSYLNELAGALQFHIHEAFAYHKYHLDLLETKQNFHNIKNDWHAKWTDVENRDLEQTVCELEVIKSQLEPYKKKCVLMSEKSTKVAPLHLRKHIKPRIGHPAVLLTTICLEDGTWLERGSKVTVSTSSHVSTRIQKEWQVEATLKSGRKKIIRLPSACLWLLCPESSPGASVSKSPTSIHISDQEQIDVPVLSNQLASAEFYQELEEFYREVKDEYRQDIIMNLNNFLATELNKTDGPIKTDNLGEMFELLASSNILSVDHPVNHTDMLQDLTRNVKNIEEHLIALDGGEPAQITQQVINQMYKPLKAWKAICDESDELKTTQSEICKNAINGPSIDILCKNIKQLLDSHQNPSYHIGGLTCLADVQLGDVTPADLHKQLRQLSRNVSIRRSRKTTTSFTQMSPRSTFNCGKLDDSHSQYLFVNDPDPSAPHLLPCPCKYCGVKEHVLVSGTYPDSFRPEMIAVEESKVVYATAPRMATRPSLPRYPLDEVPAGIVRDRDRIDDLSVTDREPSVAASKKGNSRFKKGFRGGARGGHISDDYTSGIDSALDSGGETTVYEQDAPPTDSKKAKLLCPTIPSSHGKKGKKQTPAHGYTLELPEPPEHEMIQTQSETLIAHRHLDEPQPQGVEGYTWVNRGIPMGSEIPKHGGVLVQRSPPQAHQYQQPNLLNEGVHLEEVHQVYQTTSISSPKGLVKESSFEDSYEATMAKQCLPAIDSRSMERKLVEDEILESLCRSRKEKKGHLRSIGGSIYEDQTIEAVSRSRSRPPLVTTDHEAGATDRQISDEEIPEDFTQLEHIDDSDAEFKRQISVLPGATTIGGGHRPSRKRSKVEDNVGRAKSLSRSSLQYVREQIPEQIKEDIIAPVYAATASMAYTEVCRAQSRDRLRGLLDYKGFSNEIPLETILVGSSRSLERGALVNTSMQAHSPMLRRMLSEEYMVKAAVSKDKAQRFDAFLQTRRGSGDCPGSFKNHRVQAGFPSVYKQVRAIAVQIGTDGKNEPLGESIIEVETPKTVMQTNNSHFIQDEDPYIVEKTPSQKIFASPFTRRAQMDEDEYSSMNTEKLEPHGLHRAPRLKRRAKRVQCGDACLERKIYSTAFQIGPRTQECGVDAQLDLLRAYISQSRSPGQGKKMQVGETLEEFRKAQTLPLSVENGLKSEIALSPIGQRGYMLTELQMQPTMTYNVSQPAKMPLLHNAPPASSHHQGKVYQQMVRLPIHNKVACTQCGRYTPEARSKRIQKGSSQLMFDDPTEQLASGCGSSPLMHNSRSRARYEVSSKNSQRTRSAHSICLHITIVDSDDSSDEDNGNNYCFICGGNNKTIHLTVDGRGSCIMSGHKHSRLPRSRSCGNILGTYDTVTRIGDSDDKKLCKIVNRCGIKGVEDRLQKFKPEAKEPAQAKEE